MPTEDQEGLRRGLIATRLGEMVAVSDGLALVVLDFVDRRGLARALEKAQRCAASLIEGEDAVIAQARREVCEYFAGERREFSLTLAPRGTPFQHRVWQALRDIPYGQTRTYMQQARALGHEAGVRAVAMANGANFLSVVIPCHRVIGSDGSMTGYGGGLERKRWLLAHEGALGELPGLGAVATGFASA